MANTTNCYSEVHNWTLPVPHIHTLKNTLLSFYITESFSWSILVSLGHPFVLILPDRKLLPLHFSLCTVRSVVCSICRTKFKSQSKRIWFFKEEFYYFSTHFILFFNPSGLHFALLGILRVYIYIYICITAFFMMMTMMIMLGKKLKVKTYCVQTSTTEDSISSTTLSSKCPKTVWRTLCLKKDTLRIPGN